MFDIGTLACNIKKYREKKGISQKELADKIFVSPQAISKWERGLSVPEIEKLCLLAQLLGCSIDTLVGNSEENETLMIGVDGGGTKTEYILFNENGTIFKRIVGRGMNPNFYGLDNACKELKKNIKFLLTIKPNVKGAFIGGAGLLTSVNSEYVKGELKKSFPMIKIRCKSDMLNIIASATDEKMCLGSISGTGNIAFSYKNGEITKYGGYGTLFDKAGSGYNIGRDAILAALQESEGIGETTLITKAITEKIGGNVIENIRKIYDEDVSYIASYSSIVFDALEKGDRIARQIVEENADYAAKLINVTHEKNKESSTVVLAGSLYKNEIFFESVKEKLNPELRVIKNDNPPVLGACVLACRMVEADPSKLKEKFKTEYEKHL